MVSVSPAFSAGPRATSSRRPASADSWISCTWADCRTIAPAFSAMISTPSSATGSRRRTRASADEGSVHAICTAVAPGANGPWTVTRAPLAAACGDDPSSTVVFCAPSGISNTSGASSFTGAAPRLTISNR